MEQPPSVLGGSAIRSPLSPLTFDDPDVNATLDFVGHGAYHQFIRCPRTGMRVSFSEAGARDAAPVLYCLPSFCSRYVGGANIEQRARKMDVRVIAIDRPGSGGTDRCSIDHRVDVYAQHVASVLEYLGIKTVSLMSHSSGAIYVLDLLANHPNLLGPSPRAYLISAWVPTSVSSQFGLQLIPGPLIGGLHNILPSLLPFMKSMDSAFAFSSGLVHHGKKQKEKEEDSQWVLPERFRKEGQKYEPKAPYHVRFAVSPEVGKCIDSCALLEAQQGLSQEYFLCLGRGGPVNEALYRKNVANIAKGYTERGDKASIEVFWASDDGLIPEKGRKWLDELMSKAGDAIDYRACQLEGVGHDEILSKIEVMGAIFEDIRDHARHQEDESGAQPN